MNERAVAKRRQSKVHHLRGRVIPGQRIAFNRCCIRLRSSSTSPRAQTRSRTASCAGVGTRIAVSSPARCNRANLIASRLSVSRPVRGPLRDQRRRDHSQPTPIEDSSRYSS